MYVVNSCNVCVLYFCIFSNKLSLFQETWIHSKSSINLESLYFGMMSMNSDLLCSYQCLPISSKYRLSLVISDGWDLCTALEHHDIRHNDT
jgi:hypothetical protein